MYNVPYTKDIISSSIMAQWVERNLFSKRGYLPGSNTFITVIHIIVLFNHNYSLLMSTWLYDFVSVTTII